MSATADSPEPRAAPLIEVSGISKVYDRRLVLRDVSLSVRPGESIGLVGKNGSGKSTLLKAIVGAIKPDGGSIAIAGEARAHLTPAQSLDAGIAMVPQDPHLAPLMSIAENVGLGTGYPRNRLGLISRSALARRVEEILGNLGLAIDPATPVGTLSVAEQRLVAIARALYRKANVIILDEPTTSLNLDEVETLHAVLGRVLGRGAAIVYVSHRLNEIFDLCSRVVVLRDGLLVADRPVAGFTPETLIEQITGPADLPVEAPEVELAGQPPAAAPGSAAPAALLEAKGMTGSGIGPIDLRLAPGEVIGLAGLVGSGRSTLLRMLGGSAPVDGGEVRSRGEAVDPGSARQMIGHGVVSLPEDRRAHGIIAGFAVFKNATVASLGDFRRSRWLPFLERAREREATRGVVDRLAIATAGLDLPAERLSGGNQQKLIVGRWLLREADVFLCDEPMQGVDVRGKQEIAAILRELADAGGGVIVASSDFSDLVGLCDRVLVLREGRQVAELPGARATTENLTLHCYGRAVEAV